MGTRGASEELFIGEQATSVKAHLLLHMSGCCAQQVPSAGNDGDDWGFERGTTRSYQFEVDSDLGELKRVFVRQVCLSSAHSLRVSWPNMSPNSEQSPCCDLVLPVLLLMRPYCLVAVRWEPRRRKQTMAGTWRR